MFRITGDPEETNFPDQVIRGSGQNLTECLQCGKCSGGCPITSETVGGPRKLIAMVLCGMKEQALNDPTWWYCVSCGTCAARCPADINMYRVATTLCEMAEAEGIKPSEPDIHLFEELFLDSVKKSGRVQELKTVMAFNLRTLNPFKDMIPGMKLFIKGAISPKALLESSRPDPAVADIFSRVEQVREAAASEKKRTQA